jgi:hypothetical protein
VLSYGVWYVITREDKARTSELLHTIRFVGPSILKEL